MLKNITNYNYLFILEIICIIYLANRSHGQNSFPNNPCPDIFSYGYEGDDIIGKLIIPTESNFQKIDVGVELSYGVQLMSSYVGQLELFESRQQSANNAKHNHKIDYRIRFPIQYAIPKLTKVTVDSRTICTGPPVIASYVTKINLKHSFFVQEYTYEYSPIGSNNEYGSIQSNNQYGHNSKPYTEYHDVKPNNEYSYYKPNNEYGQTNPHNEYGYYKPNNEYGQVKPNNEYDYAKPNNYENYYPQQQISPKKPQIPFLEETDLESEVDQQFCGHAMGSPHVTHLVYKGEDTSRGAFPWLTAINERLRTNKLQFICGGSLVSTNIIVTAAHCMIIDEEIRHTRDVLVQMGRHNLRKDTEENSYVSLVKKIFVHNDYNFTKISSEADIALILLKTAVQFNQYIQPICLWSGSNDIHNIIGKKGTVVGWGLDKNGQTTAEPKKVQLEIISQQQCLNSNTLFSQLISTRTFCAGGQNHAGPCKGDSGGGFYMLRDNKWELRGLVSAAVSNGDGCDLDNYVIFTDISKYDMQNFISYVQWYLQR